MNINNNFNVLPWYYSVDQQNANKWYAYGNVWPLVSSNSQLIPFQLVIDKSVTTIGTIKVHKLADGSTIDSGLKPISIPASDTSYTILSLITNTLPSALTEGRYYCSMNIDGTDIYSEVFTVVPDLSKYIKVTYWNEDNLVYKGGAIDYSNGFKYYMYICSEVAKPEYPFEEELTKRAGYKFLESQISSKLYKFTFVAPEFICDAMRLIRLNDYIQVESRGQKYNALNFTYNPKWEEQGDLASVECEFETDNIIQKLESFNRRQQESFYNALLANANDPILFDAGVVAQYYKDSQATRLVEGKLIRELDEALIVDAPSYIPVDNGIGAAKKLDLKTILAKYAIKTEVYESLAAKWTYDNERATKWDNAATDRHTHANKSALDLIAYDAAKKTWRFTGNIALSGVVSMYADLGDLDIPNIYAGLPIDNRTIKRDISGMLFAESTTGGSFDETAMWTALGTNISTKLIATKYLNLAGYATEAFVLEKIQGLGAVFNLKGTKPTPADLPTTGNKIGDVWYVASESVGYIWLTDEKGVLRWEKFGEPVDLSAYYTKAEVDTRLATKWTTDQALITNWNEAYSLRHSHSNKVILDGINNTLINNWNSAATNSHTHANKEAIDGITARLINNWNGAATDRHTHTNKAALDLIVYDVAKKTWRFTGNIAASGVVSMYADLGDLDIPSIYAGLPIDNRTIKRDALGMLYSVSGGGSDFDKTAMWAALASTTSEQINKTHLTDALSTYVLNTDSRLSDSRNAADVYSWAKQPNKPSYTYSEITGAAPFDGRYLQLSGGYMSGNIMFNADNIGLVWTGEGYNALHKSGDNYIFGSADRGLVLRNYNSHLIHRKAGTDYYVLDTSNWAEYIDGRYLPLTDSRIAQWSETYNLRHTHANKSALDLIVYDTAKKVWRFTGNIALSGSVIMHADLGDVNIPSIYDGLPIDNVTIKRNAAGALYSVGGGGADFDKTAMWAALASTTTEQINKTHLTDALSTYVLNTDSRLSDSRNAADVYAWAKQPNPPTVDLSNYVDKTSDQYINGRKSFAEISVVSGNEFNFLYGLTTDHAWINYQGSKELSELRIGNANAGYAKLVAKGYAVYLGTSSQFLKADGSLDNVSYLSTSGGSISGTLKVNSVDSLDGKGLIYYSSGDTTIAALSGKTTIRSGLTDLIHFRGDSLHKVWDEFNDGINSGLDADLWRGLRPDQTNVLSATKLQTLRLIYGQSFNGENNVTGKLTTTSIELTDVTYDSFRTKGGIVAEGTTIQLGSIKMIVNAATKSIRFEMADGTPCNVVSSGGVVMYGN